MEPLDGVVKGHVHLRLHHLHLALAELWHHVVTLQQHQGRILHVVGEGNGTVEARTDHDQVVVLRIEIQHFGPFLIVLLLNLMIDFLSFLILGKRRQLGLIIFRIPPLTLEESLVAEGLGHFFDVLHAITVIQHGDCLQTVGRLAHVCLG